MAGSSGRAALPLDALPGLGLRFALRDEQGSGRIELGAAPLMRFLEGRTPTVPSAPTPLSPEAVATASPPRDYRSEWVVAAGAGTTLLALAGVFALARHGENIMGWYANYIIPVGALLVGLVAASGYGIAAWVTGLKMTNRLMWSVMGQLALSYFLAQYEQYLLMDPDGLGMGFWTWFDEMSRSFAWKQRDGRAGEALGALGYGVRALEIAGFVLGGVLVPLGLKSQPYCDPCRTYMRTRLIALLPAAKPSKMFSKASSEEQQVALDAALEGVEILFKTAAEGDRARLEQEISQRGPLAAKRATSRLGARAAVNLVRCPRCAAGHLAASLIQQKGNNIRTTQLGASPLGPERVRALFD